MNEFLSQLPLFSLVLTIGAYQIGLFFQRKCKTPLCNPLLISVALVVGVLLAGVPLGLSPPQATSAMVMTRASTRASILRM